jgi:hypothetical protein
MKLHRFSICVIAHPPHQTDPTACRAFATYLVPLQIGAPDMAFPRLNAASYWIYLAAGVVMLVSFFVPGGAANSGWTSYPPLADFATRGQDLWLIAILLLGLSSMLNAMNVIATVVQLRSEGLTFMRLPFLVWAQLITALLLLLAFPALQVAAVFQLMDRLASTSFFLPSGLYVAGTALQGVTGGGSALLWLHLFWFLGHPEVYVLILPAIGIVADVIAANTRRPFRAMVGRAVHGSHVAHRLGSPHVSERHEHPPGNVFSSDDGDHLDPVRGPHYVVDVVVVGAARFDSRCRCCSRWRFCRCSASVVSLVYRLGLRPATFTCTTPGTSSAISITSSLQAPSSRSLRGSITGSRRSPGGC